MLENSSTAITYKQLRKIIENKPDEEKVVICGRGRSIYQSYYILQHKVESGVDVLYVQNGSDNE